MSPFENLKLGAKISAGFGIILVLLLTSIFFGYLGFNKTNSEFNAYRTLTRTDTLSEGVQANLLESRIAFKNFIESGDNSQQSIFEEKFTKLEKYINDLHATIDDVEKSKKIEYLIDRAGEYKEHFKKVVEYKTKRDDLFQNVLNVKGPEIEKNLTAIMASAHNNNNGTAVFNAGTARYHLLLGRLYSVKYLESDDEKAINQVKQEFSELDKWLKLLQGASGSNSYNEALNASFRDSESYLNSFVQIVSATENRNLEENNMDQIGPEISKIAEEIKQSITVEQNAFGPRIKRNNDRSMLEMLAFLLLALILAIIISIGINRMVVIPVTTVTNTFKEVSEGEANLDARLNVNSQDELGDMSRYFNRFMEKLRGIISENRKQSWLKTGEAELSEKIRGEQDITSLANNIITYVAKYLNAQVGAIYLKTEAGTMKMIGSYAYNRHKNLSNEIKLGEGLVGQAALEKQTIVITNVPDGYVKISSGVGEALPRNILVSPCLYNSEVKCIIEIGSFDEFTDVQMEFVEKIGESIATSVHSGEARTRMKELLDKTIEQSEELQTQQEELRQTNEELEEQTKALKESEARLQAQQEELRVVNSELEERSKKLEEQRNDIFIKNQDLINAQREIEEKAKDLETASRYKSEFLANISHELRTPLNSILVLSQMLANKTDNTPFTDKQLEYARTIYSSGADLLKLINDILDLSKVEAGKMDINIDKMHLNDLADYAERSFREVASGKGLDFNIDIEAGLPEHICTDSQRLQQVVNNLLSNAFKFTSSGGVTLSISRYGRKDFPDKTPGSGSVAIAISDTGIGIPKDKQGIIFEAFKQSDGTTSRKYGGTGLGLSISRELARLLGGNIYLKSEEGKGSTFTLVVPEKLKDTEAFESAAAAGEQAVTKTETKDDNNGFTAGHEKTLLIIEDDGSFSNILAGLGNEKGFKCINAGDGETGIQLALKHKPDGIILDIGLPGISGWEVVERLKNNPETRNIPVHIISGDDNKNLLGLGNEVVGYLRKPASLEKLEKVFAGIGANIEKPFKKLLIVDEDKDQWGSIAEVIGNKGIAVSYADSGNKALEILKNEPCDCMVIDISLKDIPGFELLRRLRNEDVLRIPVIIYTEKSLTQDEELELQKYAESIIIKGTRSMERLAAEASLFIHGVDSKIPEKKYRAARMQQEKEDSLKGKKVLIVDDDMRNVFALSSVLEEKGIKVIAAKNGREGIGKLKQNPGIDLVLMDVMMPEMDGYTAMREIRKAEVFNKLPVIALTAKAMKEDRNKCIEAGASDYLTKPIDIDKLLSLLRVWLYK